MEYIMRATKQFKQKKSYTLGFTLIELMITVAIIAIIAAIAVPSYNGYVERARRADGKKALLNVMLLQEKYRTNHVTYGTVGPDYSHDGHYDITITTGSGGYTATADPTGVQASDNCGTFTINQDGPVGSADHLSDCWRR